MIKVAGLDWSMSSPGLCITDSDTIYLYGQSGKKKDLGTYDINENGSHIVLMVSTIEKFQNNAERFNKASSKFIDIIKSHQCETVHLEGYAMGSGRGGMTFTIGESTGFLKSALYNNGIGVNIIAPTTLKKFATGKGNANKDKMYEAFIEKLGVHLPEVGCRSDVVDAYWLQLYNLEFYEQF
jgi:Holliday junction resolvasome RuvABC endonuclease subunit